MNPSTLFVTASNRALPLALLTGMLNVLAFAPFSIWPVQIVTLALMFWLVQRETSIKRSALLGWAYGFGWSVCGVYWLYISMHTYGDMPAWMAALAVALMGLVLGAFAAAAAAFSTRLRQRWQVGVPTSLLMLFPALWALSEWLRGWVLTGLPWVVSGYAHTASPLAYFAPIVGVYGIGWLAALCAGCLALLPSKKWPLILVGLIFGTGLGLKTVDWTKPNGQPISVRLIQGNVPQEMKFEAEQVGATLAMYHDLILQTPADLIATPETAIPLLAHQLPPDYLPRLTEFARQSRSHIALGIPISDGPTEYANSVIGLTPDAGAAGTPTKLYRYDKHHLVPFGEFIPTGARWFVNMMHIPLGDFTRGPALQAPFAVKDQFVLPNICYEDLFGEEIADQLAAAHFSKTPQGTILLNVSNIGWFGDSIALPQHLQISQMRALETGRPMLRATNTGATAVIDSKGVVVARLRPFERGVLQASVQGYTGMTPYLFVGNTFIVILTLLILAAVWLLARKNRSNSPSPAKTR